MLKPRKGPYSTQDDGINKAQNGNVAVLVSVHWNMQIQVSIINVSRKRER